MLLELRWLDNQLDQVLDRSYEMLPGRSAAPRGWRRTFPLIPDREIRAVARLQMDNALLFGGVTNALKRGTPTSCASSRSRRASTRSFPIRPRAAGWRCWSGSSSR